MASSFRRWGSGYPERIAAITVAGLAGRLLFLDHQPLWRDEAFTAVVVQRPVGQMLDAVRADSAPPLAYLLDHAVAGLFSGPAAIRLVAAVAGAAAIPVGAALGRRIAGDRCGVITAALCAATPALVVSARDARMYALATTLVMLSTLLLWRAVERPGLARWCAYAAATAVALYTQYFAVFAVVAQLLAVAFVLRPRPRVAVTAAGAAGLAIVPLLPWLAAARAQFTHATDAFWVPHTDFNAVVAVFLGFYAGPPVDPGTPDKVLLLTATAFCAAAGVLVATAALVFLRLRLGDDGRRAVRFLVACGLGAILLVLVVSAWRPLAEARYMSVVWGPLFPVVGAGLALIRFRAVVGLCFVATTAASVALCGIVSHPDTPAAVAVLRAHIGPHDLVDASPAELLLLQYYGDSALLSRTRVVQDHVDWYWGTAAFKPGAVSATIPSDVVDNVGVIYRVYEPTDTSGLGVAGYRAGATQCWTDVCVTAWSP